MASARYTLNITPDPEPEQPPRERTKKEKLANFWHYYKIYFFVIAGALLVLGYFVGEQLNKVVPDYSIAVLTETALPFEVTERLQTALSPLADDRNGDGKHVVAVNNYAIATSEDTQAVDPNALMAGVTKLTADFQTGESMIFITNQPEKYQELYGIFAYNDGTAAPQDSTLSKEELGVLWGACPRLTALSLGSVSGYDASPAMDVQQMLSGYTVLRRAKGEKEKQFAYYDASMKLYDVLTEKEESLNVA